MKLEDLQREHEESKWKNAVSENWRIIESILNPTLEICQIAMDKCPNAFRLIPIEFRTEKMKKDAVFYNGENIQYIENPSESLCLLAIADNSINIKYIKNPNKNIQLRAVIKNIFALNFIKDPSEYIILKALKYCDQPVLIPSIKNLKQTPEICLSFLKLDSFNYKYVSICENPTLKQTVVNLEKMNYKIKLKKKIQAL